MVQLMPKLIMHTSKTIVFTPGYFLNKVMYNFIPIKKNHWWHQDSQEELAKRSHYSILDLPLSRMFLLVFILSKHGNGSWHFPFAIVSRRLFVDLETFKLISGHFCPGQRFETVLCGKQERQMRKPNLSCGIWEKRLHFDNSVCEKKNLRYWCFSLLQTNWTVNICFSCQSTIMYFYRQAY